MEKRLTKLEKKRLGIFAAAAFGLPLAMGVLMGINFYRGADVSAFPNAQMYYPAAGVMLAVLLTRKPEEKVPVKFYTGFLILTGVLMALCVAGVFLPQIGMAAAGQSGAHRGKPDFLGASASGEKRSPKEIRSRLGKGSAGKRRRRKPGSPAGHPPLAVDPFVFIPVFPAHFPELCGGRHAGRVFPALCEPLCVAESGDASA